jgi:hypothetical protein
MNPFSNPIVINLPEDDPLFGLDLRAVIEYGNRACQQLQQVIAEKDREISMLRKILSEKNI